MMLELLSTNPPLFWTIVVGCIVSVTLHELAHGAVAILLGDDTPRRLGHMTWNPIVHMGFLSLVLLLLAGICWGAMPVDPRRLRGRFGHALVALAGPASNVLIAFVALTLLALWIHVDEAPGDGEGRLLFLFLTELGPLNLALACFNLLPIPPLDGATVLAGFSASFRRLIESPALQPYLGGVIILVILVLRKLDLSFFALGDWLAGQYLLFCLR